MKRLKYFCLALMAFSLLAIPAAAQKGRSNKGGQDQGNVGDERVTQVHNDNLAKKKAQKDKDSDPSASTKKKHGKHLALGHRH